MHYFESYYWGMHFIWWVIWILLLLWIFVTPYDIPGQKNKRDTPLDILKRRFANGEISKEEFEEHRKVLEDGK